MFRIKRLYTYILQTFTLQLLMTFIICLFILLMQFLWKYVDEMVGKGLDVAVLGEFFVYAAITLMPQAFPLSILLASLMTFGNMGEKLELLAIKAAGISLIRMMRPLIALIFTISVGSFLFQDYVIPKSQMKMWSLLLSIKQKSPELDIPEGSFYKEIDGWNILVRQKDKKTGLLKDVMIYDFSKGFDNASIILADSARLRTTDDKLYLVLNLYDGEQFENLEKQSAASKNIPYRRETFQRKDVLIVFDTNFNRMDDGILQNRYDTKNIRELQHSIDSMTTLVDSVNHLNVQRLLYVEKEMNWLQENAFSDTAVVKAGAATVQSGYNVDSLYAQMDYGQKETLLREAVKRLQKNKSEFQIRYETVEAQAVTMRKHVLGWHKKFSLAFACLIFFFIGAPLGAIIRKGGLGMPVILSVLLFIFYYIIDNIGYKMGKSGVWEEWQGSWLSAMALTPLGVFLTYKATKDSAILNADAYANFFKKVLHIKEKTREIKKKDFVEHDPDYSNLKLRLEQLTLQSRALAESARKKYGYVAFWIGNAELPIESLSDDLEELIELLRNSQDTLLLHKLSDYPVLSPEASNIPVHAAWLRYTLMICFPIGLIFYLRSLQMRKRLCGKETSTIIRLNNDITEIIHKYI